MSTDPKVAELLAPLTGSEDELASRRFHVDRERIVSRMVETSLAPKQGFGPRTRRFAGLALAATFLLASWGGLKRYEHSAAPARTIEVLVLRGSVKGVSGSKAIGLTLGEASTLQPEGTLETSESAAARIKTQAGLEIDLQGSTKISLSEMGADSTSPALRLERGRVRCVVTHQPGRTFSVVTDAARVVDIGTIFSVTVLPSEAGPNTTVHVEEGEVVVQFAGGERHLVATESWTSGRDAGPAPAAPTAPADSTIASTPAAPSPRREPAKRAPETLAAETKLLRTGLASERRGDLNAAAVAFRTLIARYPESQLAPDAKAALQRVMDRQESSK